MPCEGVMGGLWCRLKTAETHVTSPDGCKDGRSRGNSSLRLLAC